MSWQAQSAVTHHSTVRNVDQLQLLHYLADRADDCGLIDPAPNQGTLADFFNTTKRTIRARLNGLKQAGELEQTRVGSGPGNPSAYKITLPMPDTKGGSKAEENGEFFAALRELKAEIKAEIAALKAETKAEIAALKAETMGKKGGRKAEKAEAKGGKGGSERRKAHSTKSAHDPILDPILDPNLDLKGDPPTPPRRLHQLDPALPFDDRLIAIAEVCERDTSLHREALEQPAAQLARFDGDYIRTRYGRNPAPDYQGWQWYRDDWRGQKGQSPEPRDVVATIGKSRPLDPSQNGQPATGRQMSHAEAAGAEYARLRQEFSQ